MNNENEDFVLFTNQDLEAMRKNMIEQPTLIESFLIALDSKAYFMLQDKDIELEILKEEIKKLKEEN